jgi:TetR/AcrR family transcriptional regulator, copper-responsive repressor
MSVAFRCQSINIDHYEKALQSMKRAIVVQKTRGRPRSFDREAALQRAIKVFWKHGYEATSINDLTHAMGINPPSLYAAFGDKEKLFMEVVDHYVEERRAAVMRAFAEPTARRAVERWLTEAANALAQDRVPRGCLLVMSDTNCSAQSRHVQEALASRRASMTKLLKSRIDRGVKEGDVPGGTDTASLADFYSVVLQGMVMLARDRPLRKSLLAAVQTAMRAWPEPASRSRRVLRAA